MTECDKPNATGLWAMKEAGKEAVLIQVFKCNGTGFFWTVAFPEHAYRADFPAARYIPVDWPKMPEFSDPDGLENVKAGDLVRMKLQGVSEWFDEVYGVAQAYSHEGDNKVNVNWTVSHLSEHDVRRVKPPEPLT